MTNDPSQLVERRDTLQHLHAAGFDRLLAALLDPNSYTRDGLGRVVLAKVARHMCTTPRRAAAILRDAKRSLQ